MGGRRPYYLHLQMLVSDRTPALASRLQAVATQLGGLKSGNPLILTDGSGTALSGARFVLRACILYYGTTEAGAATLVDAVRPTGADLAAS